MIHTNRRNPDSSIDSAEVKIGAQGWLRLAQTVFVLLCAETLFSVPYRSVYLLRKSAFQAWFAELFVLAVIGIGFKYRQTILIRLSRFLKAPSIGNNAWLWLWLIIGITLRSAWALRFPVPLKSDNAAYFDIASRLAHGQNIDSIFLPPGLSLFLSPFLLIFGSHRWVPLICDLFLFIITYTLTYALANQIKGGLAARIAPMLVAIWPGFFPLAGVNSKETLLAALVPATLFFYLKASDLGIGSFGKEIRWGYMITAGFCMGFAALTQPGFLLFPCVLFGFEMLRGTGFLNAALRITVISIAMLTAILPWTYRNYLNFHRMVLISTNGGTVYYLSNNPLADPFINAGHSDIGEIPLPDDEFEADKLGYKLGNDWIVHHPGAFAVLMIRKQVVFLGDDALGAFESLKFHLDKTNPLYAPAKAISNLFWLGLWTLLFFGFPLLFRLCNWQLWYGLLFLPFVYQWAIDSVFESGPRHHVPYVALIGVLVGIVLSLAAPQETRTNQ